METDYKKKMEINMMKHNYNKKLDIPQDADSARYFIPEGYIAKFEDGVLIVEPKESEDAMMEKAIVDALLSHCNSINLLSERGYQIEDVKAWLEKQKEQKLAECNEVELTFRGEKVKVKRQFFRDDKGRKYSTTEQDEDAAWYALRAWCEKKGVSLYDL